MSAVSLMTRTGTLVTVTEGAPDIYGNPTPATTTSPVRFELQQQRRDETGDPTSWQVGTWWLFLPPDTDVAGVDRFIDDQGVEYEFNGPPWLVHNPRTGQSSHIEATLKQVA